MSTISYKLGFEEKMYIGTASQAPSTELKTVKDLTLTLQANKVDATSRQTGAYKIYIPGMIDASVDFTLNIDSNDTNLATLRSAYFGRTAVAVKIELGDGYYFQADMIVEEFTNKQETEGIATYTVKLAPTVVDSTFLPTVSAVSSGTGSGD